MVRLRFLILILLLSLISGCSPYFKFDELYDQGHYLEAYSLLGGIEKTNNIQYQKRVYRAVIKLALEGDQDFILRLQGIISNYTHPDLADYSNFSVSYLLFLNQEHNNPETYQSIISNFSHAEKIPSEFYAQTRQLEGIAYFKLGDFTKAINSFHESYKISPYIDNYYFIGLAYSELEEYEKAFSYFNKVVDFSDNDLLKGISYYQKGEILYYQEKYEAAMDEYLQSIYYYPNSANFNFKIGKCLQKMGYNNLAPQFFRISLKIQNNFANAWYFLNIN